MTDLKQHQFSHMHLTDRHLRNFYVQWSCEHCSTSPFGGNSGRRFTAGVKFPAPRKRTNVEDRPTTIARAHAGLFPDFPLSVWSMRILSDTQMCKAIGLKKVVGAQRSSKFLKKSRKFRNLPNRSGIDLDLSNMSLQFLLSDLQLSTRIFHDFRNSKFRISIFDDFDLLHSLNPLRCSTSLPGGNQVGGLPPASSTPAVGN